MQWLRHLHQPADSTAESHREHPWSALAGWTPPVLVTAPPNGARPAPLPAPPFRTHPAESGKSRADTEAVPKGLFLRQKQLSLPDTNANTA